MKIKSGFMLREVADNYIVVPVGKASLQFNGLITLNEVGAYIWRRIEKQKTVEEIASDLSNEYDVSYDEALSDTKDYIKKMAEANLLE